MSPLRIAIFVGTFPAVSETFIQRQIAGLIALGHHVDIYAETREAPEVPVHSEVKKFGLLERTIFMDMPSEATPWEMPIWPITGRTWLPGSETSTLNCLRLARALPKIARCFCVAPKLTIQTLSQKQFGYQASSLSALYRLHKLLSQKKKYDVLHAHFGPVGDSYRFAKQLWDVPFIVSFHGYDHSMTARERGADVYKKLFAAADAITVNSRFAQRAVEFLGCPPAKIEQLNYGLALDEFPFRERTIKPGETVRILSVGRLVEKKGFEYALRAVAKVREKHPDIRYEIIGDGPLKESLQSLARDLGISELVHFLGARVTAFIQQAMAQSHIFILASVTASDGDQEGTPVSILEAQASGLPVLSTVHAGIPEILADGQSGFLVPEKDVAALTDRLNCLVEHPHEWPNFGGVGRARMQQYFNVIKLNQELEILYRKVIDTYRNNSIRPKAEADHKDVNPL